MHINNKKRVVFKSGFTLVELIATIGIVGIVLVAAYSMANFGNSSFNKGSAKSDIQSSIRLAANYVTKELRYSSNAKILNALPATEDLINNYKYIYVEDGILKQYNNVNGKTTNISGGTLNNISTILEFEIQNSKAVYFNIKGTYKNETFQLGSTILLMNIGNNTLIDGTGPVISYTSQPIIANINFNSVQKISLAPSKFIIN